MREGYDLDAVDDFVDLVIDALDGRSSGSKVMPEQIENEEFKVVRMREGYVMDDVDDWLDAAAAELRRLRKQAQAPAQAPVQAAAHSVPQGYGTQPGPVAAHHSQAGTAAPSPQVAPPMTAPVPPAAAPPMTPPAAATGYAPPVSQPTSNPGYQQFYDTEHGAPTGYGQQYTSHGTSHGAGHGTTHAAPGYDPLTDSAVNELDPVLRALDPSYTAAEQFPPPATQAVPVDEPAGDDQSLSPSTTPSTGLHHVEVWVRDLDSATRSFGWLFERLGWTLFQAWDQGRSWQAPGGGPYVVVESSPDMSWVAYDRKAPGLNHLALAVPEQWMVDRIVSEAPAYGWRLMFADRHPYAGGPHHYAAYMENDEGFEVEVVAP